MPSDRLTARRRELQRQIEEANDRICANGRDLKKAFQQWVNAAHEDGLLAFLAQLADCYGRLVQRTPVDTGRARAGWHIEGEPSEWKPAPGEYEKAKAEILAQLDNCRAGAFEDWELEGARRAVVSALRSAMDAQGRLEDYWLGQAVAGLAEPPQDLVDRVEAVTRAQVTAVAQKMELDTIYFLKGKED